MNEQLQKLRESSPDCNLIGVVLRCVFFNKIKFDEKLRTDLYRETVNMLGEVLGADRQKINTAVFETFKEVSSNPEEISPKLVVG